MKAAIRGLLISLILLPLIFAAGCKETKQEAGKPPTFKSKEVIITNEIIIPKNPGEYQEVRHIVLRGTNEEIGKAIGDIAQKWLGIKLGLYAGPVYARARQVYMKNNYPVLLERMKGVARSYGISAEDNTYVTSALFYDLVPIACSAVYLPPDYTTTGKALYGHNVDFYISTLREMLGLGFVEGEQRLYSRNYVMELYPDKGYASIVAGSLDLLNGMQSGINSEGLLVAILADNYGPVSVDTSSSGDSGGGLNELQLCRLILDTCATLDETKIAILNNKLLTGFEPGHIQVCDRFGNSFIFEVSKEDFNYHFTDNKGLPQIMTNHAVSRFPDVNKFPGYPPTATYNSFYRYRKLYDYLQSHEGKFSEKDVKDAMSLVYGHTHDKDEGAAHPIPLRTRWTMVYDMNERSFEILFYLKDGDTDPKTGDPMLIFSETFKFKLKKFANKKEN